MTPKGGPTIKSTCKICGHPTPGQGSHCPNCRARLDSNLPNPGGIEIKLDGRGLTMTRKWFKLSAVIILTLLAIAWPIFPIFVIIVAFEAIHPLFLTIVAAIFILFEAGLIYLIIALFCNSTEINIDRKQISCHHGPIPWTGNRTIETAGVKDLYIDEKVHYNPQVYTKITYYDIMVVDSSGKHIKLISSVGNKAQTAFILQELRGFMNDKKL